MIAKVYSLEGKVLEKVKLPKVFSEPLRKDLILRAVLATLSKLRQPYGTDKLAGKRTSAHYHGRRRVRWTMMGREMARMARLHGKIAPHMAYRARKVPQAVKGRRAHPPKPEKKFEQKINKKERRKAIRSAIGATANEKLVKERGHKFEGKLPIVVEDAIEEIKKTSEIERVFEKIGLGEELKRVEERKIRAGKGTKRGRKYKVKIGPLIVVSKDRGIGKAVRNIPGVHVARVENLSALFLAPGAMPGRLTVWTKSSIKKLGA